MSKDINNDFSEQTELVNNINSYQDNSFSNFIFNSYSDLNQEYEEEENLTNKMANLSINNLPILNKNKINNNSYINISDSNNSNLVSSKSTEFSSIISLPLSNDSQKIYEHLYEYNNDKKFNLKNSIIISDEEKINREIYIKIIEDFYFSINTQKNNDRNMNKICFLVIDTKKIDKLLDKLNQVFGLQKKIMILQGGKGKKMKNDYNKFIEFIKNTDIFIAVPDVFYKLLSIGFIKIYQFNIHSFQRITFRYLFR